MAVVLDGLRPLYKSMRTQGLERQRFPYSHGVANFDVFFFIDSQPFELLFGAHGHNLAFSFKVLNGFVVQDSNLSKEDYSELCRILDLTYDPNNKFSPASFLSSFNEKIPTTAKPDHVPQAHETVRFRRDVAEADKKYFCGWRNNNIQKDRVTPENLAKTLELLGKSIYEMCKRRNISTRWTDIAADRKDFFLPD